MGSQSGFGPGFQDASSKLYRLEYAAATLAILAYLIFRWLHLGGLDWPATVFWIVLPDLAAFIPIGLSSKRKEWPAWGSYLYNTFHNGLVWGIAFGALWLVLGSPTGRSSGGLGTSPQTGRWGMVSARPLGDEGYRAGASGTT